MTVRATFRVAAFAGLPVLLVALMPRLGDRLVYFPTRAHDGGTPAALGLVYDDVHLEASDGVRLHAWFVPGAQPKPAVLLLHGNAGNVSHRLDKLAVLHGLGASVLMLDYRGYGASEGSPDEEGTYRDADAAYDWLRARGYRNEDIVLYGESLGGAVATDLAARRPVGGLVLESAPSSIAGVARHHYPFLPIGLFLSLRYDALARIGRVSAPILFLHSTEDEIVPFTMAEEMFAAALEPRRLVRLRGGHNDCFVVSAGPYADALREFLAARRAAAAS